MSDHRPVAAVLALATDSRIPSHRGQAHQQIAGASRQQPLHTHVARVGVGMGSVVGGSGGQGEGDNLDGGDAGGERDRARVGEEGEGAQVSKGAGGAGEEIQAEPYQLMPQRKSVLLSGVITSKGLGFSQVPTPLRDSPDFR
jgi:hypothetical protein